MKVMEYEKGTEVVKSEGKVSKKKKNKNKNGVVGIAHTENISSSSSSGGSGGGVVVAVSGDECVRALYSTLVTDETAVKLFVPMETPLFSYGYPRVLAALKKAVAEQNSRPQLAAYAMYCLAFLAQFDPSLGDAIEMMNRVLNSPKICMYISRPAALVYRSCVRILRAPADRRSQEESHRGMFVFVHSIVYVNSIV
jgi:hypothetical protein